MLWGPHTLLGRMLNGAGTWENKQLLKMLHVELQYGPAVLFEENESMHPYRFISVIIDSISHNNQVVQTT